MKIVFKSKVSFWLAALVYGITIISFLPVFFMPETLPMCIFTMLIVLESCVLGGIRYTIDGNSLNVTCCGYKCPACDISTITEIKSTHDMLSAPAASLDRIKIIYDGSRSLVISPKDRERFINCLLKRNPDIKVSI